MLSLMSTKSINNTILQRYVKKVLTYFTTYASIMSDWLSLIQIAPANSKLTK
jgi:hypothetical protein